MGDAGFSTRQEDVIVEMRSVAEASLAFAMDFLASYLVHTGWKSIFSGLYPKRMSPTKDDTHSSLRACGFESCLDEVMKDIFLHVGDSLFPSVAVAVMCKIAKAMLESLRSHKVTPDRRQAMLEDIDYVKSIFESELDEETVDTVMGETLDALATLEK